ncbi:hypothetical protein Tco_0758812 [Tanacetum coccineum]
MSGNEDHHRQGRRFAARGNRHDERDPRDVEIERLRQRVRELEINPFDRYERQYEDTSTDSTVEEYENEGVLEDQVKSKRFSDIKGDDLPLGRFVSLLAKYQGPSESDSPASRFKSNICLLNSLRTYTRSKGFLKGNFRMYADSKSKGFFDSIFEIYAHSKSKKVVMTKSGSVQ